jgi:exodeoxyribonuclease X
MKPFDQTTFLIVDTETTGLDPAVDRICEIGFVLAIGGGLARVGETFVDPQRSIPPEVSAIHHITDEMVKGKPIMPKLGIALPQYECLVAHNAPFDRSFLPWFAKKPWLDTLRLARHILPDSPQHGNQYLRYALKLAVPECENVAAHRALADCFVTGHLLHSLLAKLPEDAPKTLPEIIAWTERPILQKVCGFKKH